MCGRQRQRHGLAATLITSFVEHQEQRQRGLSSPEQSSMASNTMSSSTQFHGVTNQAPAYAERGYEASINPNPPSYEEIVGEYPSRRIADIPNEKPSKYEKKGTAATPTTIPPHEREYDGYSPNTGLDENRPLSRQISASSSDTYDHEHGQFSSPAHVDTFPENMPQFPSHIQNPAYPAETLPRLLAAISLYFDTKIHMNQHHPGKVRHLERRKANKLEKVTRKYEDKILNAKDARYADRMEKRAAKMEKWTTDIVRRYEEHQARKQSRGAYKNAEYGRGYGYGQGRCGGGERGFGRRPVVGGINHAPQMMGAFNGRV